jgi:Calcineurin-like phosphoesterase
MHLFFAVLLALTQQWLVVSDLHVNPYDRSAQPSDYGSDTNWVLFDATIAQMRRAEPNPSVVIVPGDFLAHHFATLVQNAKPGASTTTEAEAVMKRIARSFDRAFPRAQFIITLGNNDDPCGDYKTAPNTPYLAAVARIWAPLVNRNGAAPDFVREFSRAGHFTARLPIPGVRAVVPDDVYWSIVYRPCGNVPGNPPARQFNWFSRALSASKSGRSIVVMHIPPGVDENSTQLTHRFIIVPFLQGAGEAALEHVFSAHEGQIAFALAGHIHQNGFRVVAGVPVLVAPAVSPIYRSDPAFLRLQLSGDGTLLDYQLFAYSPYYDQWTEVLDFDRAYGVDAFTAQTLLEAHERIASDDAVRLAWTEAMVGGSPTRRVYSGNWKTFWCAQTATGVEYAACAGAQRRVAAVPIAAALLAGLVLVGLLAVALRLAAQRRRA